MARFHGKVGYATQRETEPSSGVWENVVVEHPYYGNVDRSIQRQEDGSGVNRNIVVNNQISVVADQFAIDHFFEIKYVEWMGRNWSVTAVEVKSPRLILNIGELYNGPTP